MIDVKETLQRLRDERRARKLIPESVLYTDLYNDIMRQVRQELNEMYAKKEISVSSTLNNKSINLL